MWQARLELERELATWSRRFDGTGIIAAVALASTKAQKAAFEEALEVWNCRNDRIMNAKVQKKHSEALKSENISDFQFVHGVCCNLFPGTRKWTITHDPQAERASYEAESRGLKIVL